MACYELLRGQVLTDGDCKEILLGHTGNISQQISEVLGASASVLPDLRTPEGMLAQYNSQRLLAVSGGLPVEDCFEDVLQHLAQPSVQRDLEKGPRLLLLVPRRPLAEYVTALQAWLSQNVHLLQLPAGRPLADEPVYIPDQFKQGLEYHCPVQKNGQIAFEWRTERQWMDEQSLDIHVLEPSADLPASAQRRSANDAWNTCGAGEVFLTPQTWSMLFRTLLERGELLDARTWSILAGARLAKSKNDSTSSPRHVPDAGWRPGDRQVWFIWDYPGDSDEGAGVRGSR
jgi:hypothetical protein